MVSSRIFLKYWWDFSVNENLNENSICTCFTLFKFYSFTFYLGDTKWRTLTFSFINFTSIGPWWSSSIPTRFMQRQQCSNLRRMVNPRRLTSANGTNHSLLRRFLVLVKSLMAVANAIMFAQSLHVRNNRDNMAYSQTKSSGGEDIFKQIGVVDNQIYLKLIVITNNWDS